MSSRAAILTYHGVEARRGPLFVDPGLFASQLDAIVAAGAVTFTIGELAARLRADAVPDRAVAITFDDGFASVVEVAAPLLAERGLTATVFCVAGHLGGTSDWATARGGVEPRPLAGARALRELVAAGFEIGSHGLRHAPLARVGGDALDGEVVASRRVLEEALDAEVRTFAYPYGALPSGEGRRAVARTYEAACSMRLELVTGGSDLHALPRVDAHYVRRPELIARLLEGELGARLVGRRLGARVRRVLRQDYKAPVLQ